MKKLVSAAAIAAALSVGAGTAQAAFTFDLVNSEPAAGYYQSNIMLNTDGADVLNLYSLILQYDSAVLTFLPAFGSYPDISGVTGKNFLGADITGTVFNNDQFTAGALDNFPGYLHSITGENVTTSLETTAGAESPIPAGSYTMASLFFSNSGSFADNLVQFSYGIQGIPDAGIKANKSLLDAVDPITESGPYVISADGMQIAEGTPTPVPGAVWLLGSGLLGLVGLRRKSRD